MEDFRKLNNGVLGIQIFKVQTEALNTYKKNSLEELGTIVYTNISQGLSDISQGLLEDKKVKELCDRIKGIDNQIKEKEGEILKLSDKIKESILGLKPIPSCNCGTELYEGIKYCYECGKKVVEDANGEGEEEEKREKREKKEKKSAADRACNYCGKQLPKDSNYCTHCGVYTDPDLLAPPDAA
jgi:uncharacterized coiled-coil DUF342 family protein